MCLILFAYQQHPRYPLIVAANRDEFFERPTAPSDIWPASNILAGRDLRAGGSWMGLNIDNGRFAAVTNVRQFNTNGEDGGSGARSRGELVSQFLLDDCASHDYLRKLEQQQGDYSGYNLLVGDHQQLHYASNNGSQNPGRQLSAGLYGLSNGVLDQAWPKVQRGKRALTAALDNNGQEELLEQLLEILSDHEHAEDKDLPDTGIGIEAERILSPLYICGEHYGTRASTALLIDHHGNYHWLEHSFDANRQVIHRSRHSGQLG